MLSINRTASTVSSVCSDSGLDATGEQSSITSPSNGIVSKLCLIGDAKLNTNLRSAILHILSLELVESSADDGSEFMDDEGVAFVFADFESEYKARIPPLRKHQIYGPTMVFECAKTDQPLPVMPLDQKGQRCPIYCTSMKNLVICFTGFSKYERARLVRLVRWMSGKARERLGTSLHSATHLVSKTAGLFDHQVANCFQKAVMSSDWVESSWARRELVLGSALSSSPSFNYMDYKLKPFARLALSFQGFDEQTLSEMQALTKEHGGEVTEDIDSCQRVVVDINALPDWIAPEGLRPKVKIVAAEWFWVSIQYETCANEELFPIDRKPFHSWEPVAPLQILQGQRKRKSSMIVGKSRDVSVSMGSLDLSADMSSMMNDHAFSTDDLEMGIQSPDRNMTKRQRVCTELLQTEANFMNILTVILKIFKEPLENPMDDEHQLLDKVDIKTIFGNLDQISEIHQKVLNNLAQLMAHWNDKHLVGKVWCAVAPELKEAYPKFVNNFEAAKEALQRCSKTNQRFHAFKRACESKTDCKRERLEEMMIRPVQRLPSVQLILADILKQTDKSNPDKRELEQALVDVKDVLTHINENKRQTEAQLHMFKLCGDIEDAPPHLLSAQRQMIAQAMVEEVTHLISGIAKGQPLMLILFNDCLEIVKIRSGNKPKKYRHLAQYRLSVIRQIVDVEQDRPDAYYLIIRGESDLREYRILFQHLCYDPDKSKFISAISRAVANFVGRLDREMGFVSTGRLDSASDDIYHDDTFDAMNRSTLNRVGSRMGRALSFSRTPTSLSLKQTISSFGGTLKRMSRSNLRLRDSAMMDGTMDNSFGSGTSGGAVAWKSPLRRLNSGTSLWSRSASRLPGLKGSGHSLAPISDCSPLFKQPHSAPPDWTGISSSTTSLAPMAQSSTASSESPPQSSEGMDFAGRGPTGPASRLGSSRISINVDGPSETAPKAVPEGLEFIDDDCDDENRDLNKNWARIEKSNNNRNSGAMGPPMTTKHSEV